MYFYRLLGASLNTLISNHDKSHLKLSYQSLAGISFFLLYEILVFLRIFIFFLTATRTTTPWQLLAMVTSPAWTTGWSRTAGEPGGELTDTSRSREEQVCTFKILIQ